jgi:hypothetical protein
VLFLSVLILLYLLFHKLASAVNVSSFFYGTFVQFILIGLLQLKYRHM